MNHCVRHYEEPFVAHCRTCNRPYCSRCLVFSFGPKKPPYCVGCALNASGVRNTSLTAVPQAKVAAPDRRAERAQRKVEKSQAKAEARALKRAEKRSDPVAPDAGERPTAVPVPKGLMTPSSRFAPPPAEHAVN